MSEKIIGYILLAVGIMTIIFSGFSVYTVFTKQARPVQLFTFKGISLDASQLLSTNLPPEATQLVKPGGTQEIIPASLLNDSSNIFAHLLLMGFIGSVGYKIASLGVQLTRPIVVKLKTQEATPKTWNFRSGFRKDKS